MLKFYKKRKHMAYKIYNHVELSQVRGIVISDISGKEYTLHTKNVKEIFESLRELPVLGFALFKSGSLIVSIQSRSEQAVSTITKYYRAWRLKSARLRNDLALRGLAEYFGHPSRQDFSVGSS